MGTDGSVGRPELRLNGDGLFALASDILSRASCVRFCARGGSMHPFVRDRDILTIAPLTRPVRPGDIVAFDFAGRLTVHRLIRVNDELCVPKGDNLSAPDGAIPHGCLLGRVVRIERSGRYIRLSLGPERTLIAALSRFGMLPTLWAPLRRILHLYRRLQHAHIQPRP